MSAGQPDEHAEAKGFGKAFGNKDWTDGGAAGVDRLIDESRGPPEVGKVAEGDIAGVWALSVEVWEAGRGVGVEVSVAEVAVREGVRAVLEPNDDGVDLTDGAEEGVVYVIVNCVCCDQKTSGCIDTVGPCDGVPRCFERSGCLE